MIIKDAHEKTLHGGHQKKILDQPCKTAIKAIINRGDIEDTTALIPGHFLIGPEIVSPLDPTATEINGNHSLRWMLVQKMKMDFWNAWSTQYLHRLQGRYKGKMTLENLKIGTG